MEIRKTFFLILFFLYILYSNSAVCAGSKQTWRSSDFAGKFVTAVARDKDERLWIAGEEVGVTLVDKGTVKTFDIPYCFSIVCDDSGRVWIASLRQGLFYYEYGEMKNYNTADGLPANSIYDIAFDKYNTPYCATGLGLAKLSSEGKWEKISLPDYLPRSEITCLDFDLNGNLWVGFSLGGVAKFNGTDWRSYSIENSFGGDGRVNDVLVTRSGIVWAATCSGLNKLQPGSKNWQHITLPYLYYPENYFLKIAEDNLGNVFFTNRHEGITRFGSRDSGLVKIVSIKQLPDSFVYSITADSDGYIWAGTYGGGITTNNPSFKFPKRISKNLITFKETPKVNFYQTTYQKELIYKFYKLLKNCPEQECAYYIGEDWSTMGDWMGNYGEYAWILCGYHHPPGSYYDLLGGSDRQSPYSFYNMHYYASIGESASPDDILRGWVSWDNTHNPKALQDPLGGGRRHTEWDDHAESYERPLMREGPHIYLDLNIPEGIFAVSFYFMNKDSHQVWNEGNQEGWNKYRDYVISVKRRAQRSSPRTFHNKVTGSKHSWTPLSEKDFEESPLLASCRVHDFTAGVYKVFMLKGPAQYTIKFDKKESFNTCFAGVFVDKIERH